MRSGSGTPAATPTARLAALPLVLAAIAAATGAQAHRDDYIDETFVYQTLEARELEPELWVEARGGHGKPPRSWYTGAFELGLTPRWMVDAATQWIQGGGSFGLGRLRAETRLRFADEGAWPIDCAMSLEYEMETARVTGAEREHAVTPRLILSRDLVRSLNTTLNLDFPVAIADRPRLSFAYAVGARYPAEGLVRTGVELEHRPSERTATVFPQVWFALPHEATFKLGVGAGLTSNVERLAGRAVLEVEF